ncbi:MAG: hypothetical protein GYB65_05645, partial [Chloroflexi bacterium]|nr:hypothetical protein [Chloroflexota bacterium]
MNHLSPIDDDQRQDDELSYEDLDDSSAWQDPDGLPAIDLDALDDPIVPDGEAAPDDTPPEKTAPPLRQPRPEVRPRRAMQPLDIDALDDTLDDEGPGSDAARDILDRLDSQLNLLKAQDLASPAKTESPTPPDQDRPAGKPTIKPLDIDALDDALDDDDDDASDARRAMLGQLDAELGLPGAKDLDPAPEDAPVAPLDKPRPTLKPLDIDQLDDALDDD